MKVQLREGVFEPWSEMADYQQSNPQGRSASGACSVFVGSMRDINAGDQVKSMFLEHYPEMTGAYLEKIAQEAMAKWSLQDLLLLHRVGDIKPCDSIVLIAVWSAHRKEAFEASRYLIEELKKRAPFWKKETLADDSQRWVSENTAA